MNTSRAFLAGVVGGALMSFLMFLSRILMGMEVNLEMMMGTMFLEPGAVAWIVGLVMHLMASGAIALAYAWGFERVTHRANAGIGAGFSVVHILIAGVVMGAMIPLVHRLIPEQMEGPGFFLANYGAMGIVAFVMLHLIFGAVVGAMYSGHVRHPAPAA